MTVTFHHVGLDVTWTERGHQRVGRLHAIPAESTPGWWKTNGKATVLTDAGWVYVHPSELHLATPTEVSDAR